MAEYTPGPWQVTRTFKMMGMNGVPSTTAVIGFYKDGVEMVIAMVPLYSDEDKANAELIALAPLMMQLLEKIFDENVLSEEIRDLVRQAVDGQTHA